MATEAFFAPCRSLLIGLPICYTQMPSSNPSNL